MLAGDLESYCTTDGKLVLNCATMEFLSMFALELNKLPPIKAWKAVLEMARKLRWDQTASFLTVV